MPQQHRVQQIPQQRPVMPSYMPPDHSRPLGNQAMSLMEVENQMRNTQIHPPQAYGRPMNPMAPPLAYSQPPPVQAPQQFVLNGFKYLTRYSCYSVKPTTPCQECCFWDSNNT